MSAPQIDEQRIGAAQGRSGDKASGSGGPVSSGLDQAKRGASKLSGFAKGAAEKGGHFMGDKAQKATKGASGDAVNAHLNDSFLDLSDLEGLRVDEGGKILDKSGRQIGQVTEGDPQDLVGQIVDSRGEILDEDGDLIGRVDVVSHELEKEPTKTTQASEAVGDMTKDVSILKGRVINQEGKIVDEDGNVIGSVVGAQDPSTLAGKSVNADGQAVDDDNNVVGQVQIVSGTAADTAQQKLREQSEEVTAGAELPSAPQLPDVSTLEGLTCDKLGNIVNKDGLPVGHLVEGDAKKLSREGLKLDSEGQFWDSGGRLVGKAEPVPEEQEEEAGAFADLGEVFVADDGYVQDENRKRVGRIVEGDVQKLVGRPVDDDGDILDKRGNVLGRAEPLQPSEMDESETKSPGEAGSEEGSEEEEEQDLSILDGKVVNKMGNVVDDSGVVFGHITAGIPKKMAGKKVDAKGQVWNDTGEVIGMAEPIPSEEREQPEGPFFGLSGLVVTKGGAVADSSGQVIGRLVEGDETRLLGRAVDEDGEIMDKSGNVIGRAQRGAPEEQPQVANPMAGCKVNRDGEVRNSGGELVGKLTKGKLETVVGMTVDNNGNVVDDDGQKLGKCTLLEDLPEEPQLSPEEIEKQQQEEKERDIAKKMSTILRQTLDSVSTDCRKIAQNIEKANRTPKQDLDEEQLVKDVKPLIEEASGYLQECKGALRSLDPDGQIASTAKSHSSSREATPEEYELADLLKELTETVVTTIDNGRKMLEDMPHAKRQINPLWALLSEPLFQIIAAVGLLLSGVLGLVGQLLNQLGLGGLLNSLLGGLGIDKLLEGFGLGTVSDSLGLGGKK
ncbi:hypothetical protein BJX96DRAFT_58355 [Aspergillus floccosus]